MTIRAFHAWKNNADLINDVHRLEYIKDTDSVVDITYGSGKWWTIYKPSQLVKHDLYKLDGVDFRDLPHDDNSFDVVAFDPPYVATGGRATTTIPEMYYAYGMTEAAATPVGVQADINRGLEEANRVGRRIVLVKCQNYISSGKLFPGAFLTWQHASDLKMELIDCFTMVTSPRPQPKGRKQVHARNNGSVLYVLGVSK